MDCSLDSEHILQVSSKYLSNNRDITKCQQIFFWHNSKNGHNSKKKKMQSELSPL